MDRGREGYTLVAGGSGFLGSHLCEKLLLAGEKVLCIDNLSTGSCDNIAHLLSDSRFIFIEHDVVEPFSTELALAKIYNLACPASPIQYQKNPIATLRACIWGTYHLLELAKEREIPLLQASTSEVYGDPQKSPQQELYWGHVNPVGLRSCYDEGKRAAETFCSDYSRFFGVQTKIARIFNTYGPRMQADDGRVVSNFITQALSNKPLTLYGDGLQTRSFCFVDELVEGLIAFMNSRHVGVINLGNPKQQTIKELALLVVNLLQSSSSLTFCPLPSDDPFLRCPDITRAKELLNWSPSIGIEEGLRKTIAYFSCGAEP